MARAICLNRVENGENGDTPQKSFILAQILSLPLQFRPEYETIMPLLRIDSVVTVGYKRGDDVNLRGLPFGADYDDDGDDEEGSRRRCLMLGPGGIGPRTI